MPFDNTYVMFGPDIHYSFKTSLLTVKNYLQKKFKKIQEKIHVIWQEARFFFYKSSNKTDERKIKVNKNRKIYRSLHEQ